VEDLLDQEKHPEKWRKIHFWMQTSIIPDESFLPTFALNHPVHKQVLKPY